MSSINLSGVSTTDYSDLFSSLSSSSSNSTSSSSSLLTDWASIKNGSYGKLAKSYYGKDSQNTVDKEEASSLIKTNSELKGDANSLKSTLDGISSSASIFTNKVTSKDENGNETQNYDYEKIYSSLKNFVDSYNSVIKAGGDSDNTTVLRNTLSMTKLTSANSKLLSSVGISIGEDNKLSIDETKAKKADINELKSLFSGSSSYADMISSSAGNIINAVNAENNKLSNYTSQGAYSTVDSVGKIYDGTY